MQHAVLLNEQLMWGGTSWFTFISDVELLNDLLNMHV